MKQAEKQQNFRNMLCDILAIDSVQYENCKYNYFVSFCLDVAISKHMSLQALVTNELLTDWFSKQWDAIVEGGIEQTYGEDIARDVFDHKDIHTMFEIFFKEINVYPAVLIDMIRKR